MDVWILHEKHILKNDEKFKKSFTGYVIIYYTFVLLPFLVSFYFSFFRLGFIISSLTEQFNVFSKKVKKKNVYYLLWQKINREVKWGSPNELKKKSRIKHKG